MAHCSRLRGANSLFTWHNLDSYVAQRRGLRGAKLQSSWRRSVDDMRTDDITWRATCDTRHDTRHVERDMWHATCDWRFFWRRCRSLFIADLAATKRWYQELENDNNKGEIGFVPDHINCEFVNCCDENKLLANYKNRYCNNKLLYVMMIRFVRKLR